MSEPVTVGDLVTPENVASLPVGAIVRWEHAGKEWRATKRGPDRWVVRGVISHSDSEIAEEGTPPAFIAYLPEVP